MVRHNNMIPNNHFHKNWQKYVKTWFDQPANKIRRRLKRDCRQRKLAPKPIDVLRPVVTCPSVRYHTKKRLGRGFTLRELAGAEIHPDFAKTIGIAVDNRRKDKSYENVQTNVQRLKEYRQNLIIFPTKKNLLNFKEEIKIKVNTLKQPVTKNKARTPSSEEQKFEAYITLRKARANQKRKKKVKELSD